ncbi:MAG: aspartyl protease family protein [Hyphomonadaceae bacterium]|nr:aspartyl protease family protein [Hyphomonadaceae bacterium]
MFRLGFIAVLTWLCAGSAWGQCRTAPIADVFADAQAAGPTDDDRSGRVVAPVSVNGQGPFRFIVDTGANRSAISDRLAERLELAPSGEGLVHSVYGVAPAPFAEVDALAYGALELPGGRMPILSGPVLAGAQGLLGVDGMAGRRLMLDFRRDCIEIIPSAGAPRLGSRNWTTARGELRFGHLVVVRGRVAGIDVNVLIDTGSDTSLVNNALFEAIEARRDRRNGVERAATANETITLERAVILDQLSIGELEAQNVVAFVGDYHIFAVWDLLDQPTILLGMDVISVADAMAIDYGRATVHFRISGRR